MDVFELDDVFLGFGLVFVGELEVDFLGVVDDFIEGLDDAVDHEVARSGGWGWGTRG